MAYPRGRRPQTLPRESTIVCIGAGFSGVALGAQLLRNYNFTDIAFYERDTDIGGTWLVNKYPGTSRPPFPPTFSSPG